MRMHMRKIWRCSAPVRACACAIGRTSARPHSASNPYLGLGATRSAPRINVRAVLRVQTVSLRSKVTAGYKPLPIAVTRSTAGRGRWRLNGAEARLPGSEVRKYGFTPHAGPSQQQQALLGDRPSTPTILGRWVQERGERDERLLLREGSWGRRSAGGAERERNKRLRGCLCEYCSCRTIANAHARPCNIYERLVHTNAVSPA
eukprot:356188-Chlamydomonas_euryale.AAC.17